METYIDRLKIECDELKEKMDKLNDFLHKQDDERQLDNENIGLLEIQYSCMEAYLMVLLRRYGIQSALGLSTTDNDGRDD